MGLFDPGIRSIANQLGVRVELSSEKARRVLGWSPRPADETIVDTARSLLAAPSPTS
jgi:dihydroflavonol-4-reductase